MVSARQSPRTAAAAIQPEAAIMHRAAKWHQIKRVKKRLLARKEVLN
jgi:hypothetical protein